MMFLNLALCNLPISSLTDGDSVDWSLQFLSMFLLPVRESQWNNIMEYHSVERFTDGDAVDWPLVHFHVYAVHAE
jgi:hypothetical protein